MFSTKRIKRYAFQPRRRIAAGIAIGWLISAVAPAPAAPPNQELKAAKAIFIKDMHRDDAASRIVAVRQFAKTIQPGTADLLIKRGFTDDAEDVRAAAFAALREMSNDDAVCQFLIGELKRSLYKANTTELSVELIRAVAATTNDTLQTDVVKCLDEYLIQKKGDFLIPITAIDEDAEKGDRDSVQSLKLMSNAKPFSAHFGYRRSIVQAMTKIRQPEAIDFLIDTLRGSEGLIQFDIVEYLSQVTGQRFQDDDRAWLKWWKENRRTFQFPDPEKELPEVVVDGKGDTYYGIPICAKRIVFVLDCSGSMAGPPIDAAKRSLLKAIDSLGEEVHFNVVLFARHVASCSARLLPATPEAKKRASEAVMAQTLHGGTSSSAALREAFSYNPEAIYFLSDGEPTDGAPRDIVLATTVANRVRRMSIHTIGVVTDNEGGAGLALFMDPLAAKNYGKFRIVK